MKKTNPIAVLKKYAKFYKTKEKYINHMKKMDLVPHSSERMTEVILEGYWIYFKEMSQLERDMKDISHFIHGYVSKNIHD